MNAQEVVQCRNNGYNPWNVYSQNPYIKDVLDFIQRGGVDGKNFDTIVNYLLHNDQYMSLADFDSYRLCQQRVNDTYRDPMTWNRMSLRNIAEAGIFSADRSIQDYIDTIWYK